ncbi:unnamed protein product [Caenorhabditis auriculariae]|uniref:Cytosolic fatty-acid binding proteins domain-containing protein n=1 Tax=Caenorhabditis auriculariae TaxID=2777116 RepID=A0A8S1GVP5_9PELO|nr:unnamed protein product [Caenorhabditis auriculariae]
MQTITKTRLCVIFAFLALTCSVQMTDAKEIPPKFFGKFVLDRSENFDEFLSAKGVNWLLRQMIKLASVTKVIGKGDKPSTYNYENLTSKKNTLYHGWELGKTFRAEGLDGKPHDITFNYVNGELTEKHIRLDEPADNNTETYHYTIDDKDQLVLKMENNNIICRRWFKRQQPK